MLMGSSYYLISSMKILTILFFLSTIFLIRATTTESAFGSGFEKDITFSFPSFNNGSCSDNGTLLCMGSVTSADGSLNLTPEPIPGNSTLPLNKIGRVLYRRPVFGWPAMITTTFTVKITVFPNTTGAGDGMAFVMAQDTSPSPPNSYGSYLGIMDGSNKGLLRQLAVELDTYANEFDPDDNHIGIDTKSISEPVVSKSLTSVGINLKSGKEIQVQIDYNSYTEILQIYVAYLGNPLISFINQSIKLSTIIPADIYVGFTAATGTVPETHQVTSWVFTSMPLPPITAKFSKYDELKEILIIVIPIVCGLMIIAILVFPIFYKLWKRRNERMKRKAHLESSSRRAANAPKMFTYRQLSKATNGFSEHNLLGFGGFGSVYRGLLLDPPDPPTTIAVKKISATSRQGEREYLAEICTIGRLRHKNIVQLQGWCHEGDRLLLVYEYMANGSLDRYIGKSTLDWETRYKILTGLASSILYLHEECGSSVVHRDIKPNNVMLDANYDAHLGDFGLARLLETQGKTTTILAGTPGYMAPEVVYTGKATPESDIFSFGMVVLEVVCGKRSKGIMEENNLIDYVWSLHAKNELIDGVDNALEGKFDEEQAKRAMMVGLACIHPNCTLRPNIRKVLHIFMYANEEIMELPDSKPTGIYVSVSSSASSTMDLGPKSSSANASIT